MIRAIHPPADARSNEVNFAHWVRSVGARLLHAGITDVELVPVVTETGELFLTVDTDNQTSSRIKAALYN